MPALDSPCPRTFLLWSLPLKLYQEQYARVGTLRPFRSTCSGKRGKVTGSGASAYHQDVLALSCPWLPNLPSPLTTICHHLGSSPHQGPPQSHHTAPCLNWPHSFSPPTMPSNAPHLIRALCDLIIQRLLRIKRIAALIHVHRGHSVSQADVAGIGLVLRVHGACHRQRWWAGGRARVEGKDGWRWWCW